jgi:hypothetical protein
MAFSSTEEMKQHTERLHHAQNSRQARALGKAPGSAALGNGNLGNVGRNGEAEDGGEEDGEGGGAVEDRLARVVRKISSVSHFQSRPGIASLVEVMAAMGGMGTPSSPLGPGSPLGPLGSPLVPGSPLTLHHAQTPTQQQQQQQQQGAERRRLFPGSGKTQPRIALSLLAGKTSQLSVVSGEQLEDGDSGEDAALEVPANAAKVKNFLAAHKAAGASIKELGIAGPSKVRKGLEESSGRKSDSEELSDSAVAEASATRRARRLTVARGSGGAGTGGGGELSSSTSASLDQTSASLRARRERILRKRKGGGGSGLLVEQSSRPMSQPQPPQQSPQSRARNATASPALHPSSPGAKHQPPQPPPPQQQQQQQQQRDDSPDLISQAYQLTRQIGTLPSLSPQMRGRAVSKSVSIMSGDANDDSNPSFQATGGSTRSLVGGGGTTSPSASPSRPIFFNLSQARPSRARAESLTLKELEYPDVERDDDSVPAQAKSSSARRSTTGSRGRAMSILDDDGPAHPQQQQQQQQPPPPSPQQSQIPESVPQQARLTSPTSKLRTMTFAAADQANRKPTPPRRPAASTIETVVFVKPQDILHPKRVREKPAAEGANLVPIPTRLPSRQSLKTPTGLPAGSAHRKWQSTIIRPVSSLHHLRGLIMASTGSAATARPTVVQRELWNHHGIKIDLSQWREDGVGAGRLYLEDEIRRAGWEAEGGREEALVEAFERAKQQWIIDRGLQ